MYRRGYGHRGRGSGRGPLGFCICLRCGYKMKKQPGVRCMEIRCPKCGAIMIREGSEHHRLYLEKKGGEKKF